MPSDDPFLKYFDRLERGEDLDFDDMTPVVGLDDMGNKINSILLLNTKTTLEQRYQSQRLQAIEHVQVMGPAFRPVLCRVRGAVGADVSSLPIGWRTLLIVAFQGCRVILAFIAEQLAGAKRPPSAPPNVPLPPGLDRALAEKRKVMGMGHRVYKAKDPRAKVIEKYLQDMSEKKNNWRDYEILKEIERVFGERMKDKGKPIYPNVDFYSGIILDAMGFPTSMFTPIFALARTVGWISQWKEMIADPQLKIGRPRQLYCGPTYRDYIDVEKRG